MSLSKKSERVIKEITDMLDLEAVRLVERQHAVIEHVGGGPRGLRCVEHFLLPIL